MAQATTLVYWAKGKKPRATTDSQTPSAQSIRLPLVSNSQTFYPPELVAENLIQLPLVENEQVFYPPTLSAAPVFIALPLVENSQTFFPLTVKLSVTLPLTTNEQTFYPPQVINGQVVALPLVTNTQTFFGPQINQRVELPLVTNEQTFYGMDVRQDKFVALPLVTNEQTFYPPQLNQKVTLPLVSNSQTFYPPTLANGQVIRLPFFANGQTFFAPKINQKIILGFVNNTQTFYPPIVSATTLVVLPLVTNTQTFYPPELRQKIILPLITNTSTVFPPNIVMDTTQVINLPLVTNTQTFFGPKLNQQVRLPKITNTQGFFPLTVSNGPLPGYALTTPVLTVTSPVGEVPEVTASLASDIAAGMYLRIQRSTTGLKNASDGTYASPTLDVKHFISGTEWAEGAITNDDLSPDGYINPFGTWFQLYWIETEDGKLSGKAEVSGTVTGSSASWSGQTGVNKSQYLDVSGLSAEVNANVNSRCGARATIPSQNDEFYFEVEIDELNSSIMAGIIDGTSSLVTTTAIPGSSSTAPAGAVVRIIVGSTAASIARSNGTVAATLAAIPQAGDRLCVAGKKSAARLRFYHYRIATGTRTQIGADALLLNANPPAWYAYGGGFRKTTTRDAFTAAFASADFALAAPSGENIYG